MRTTRRRIGQTWLGRGRRWPCAESSGRVEAGNLLVCERSPWFLVAVAMGAEPVKMPTGSVLLKAEPLTEVGWLQLNGAAWMLRTTEWAPVGETHLQLTCNFRQDKGLFTVHGEVIPG